MKDPWSWKPIGLFRERLKSVTLYVVFADAEGKVRPLYFAKNIEPPLSFLNQHVRCFCFIWSNHTNYSIWTYLDWLLYLLSRLKINFGGFANFLMNKLSASSRKAAAQFKQLWPCSSQGWTRALWLINLRIYKPGEAYGSNPDIYGKHRKAMGRLEEYTICACALPILWSWNQRVS